MMLANSVQRVRCQTGHVRRLLHRRGRQLRNQALPTAWRMGWTACSRLPGMLLALPKPMEALLQVHPSITDQRSLQSTHSQALYVLASRR